MHFLIYLYNFNVEYILNIIYYVNLEVFKYNISYLLLDLRYIHLYYIFILNNLVIGGYDGLLLHV